MLKKIPKAIKIAVLGTGAVAFGSMAYKYYGQTSQIQSSTISPIVTSQINENNVPKLDSQTTSSNTQPQIQQQPNAQTIQKGKQTGHHEHNSDIRVLDMVGFPAVHGANILQTQQASTQPVQNTQQSKTVEIQKQHTITPTQQANTIAKQQQTQQKQQIQNVQKQDNVAVNQSKDKETVTVKSTDGSIQKQQQKQKQKQKVIPINRTLNYAKIKDLPVFDLNHDVKDDEFVLIVLDLQYNPKFQKQILTKLAKTLKNRQSSKQLSVYRLNLQDPQMRKLASKRLTKNLQQETILLLKNPYENHFINIDFNIYIQNQSMPATYLSDVRQIKNLQKLQKLLLKKMTANDTYLLLIADGSNQQDFKKKQLIGKYLQLELGMERMDSIKVCVVDEKIAKSAGIFSQEAKPNSLHLIRKSNQFTFKSPNRWLFDNRPYHVIENISLYDKSRNMLIPRYLGKVQTFNSLKVQAPYVCYVNIDRNRTSPKQQRQIMQVIAKLKGSEQFPMVSYVLRFGETQYRGEVQDQFAGKKFIVKVANLDQLDRQSLLHQVKNKQDLKVVGIQETKWLRDTFQYLYKQPEVTEQGLRKFITRCINNQEPQFYKSQAKHKLQHVDKLTGLNFDDKIFNNDSQNRSHVVFEYSNHCQSCQLLSPLIEHLSDVFKKFPDIGADVHALNCEKNRVKGQPYSPYTPNLYLYSRNWKNRTPLRYPLVQLARYNSIWGIYDFVIITDTLKKIQKSKFEEHIKAVTESKVRLTDF